MIRKDFIRRHAQPGQRRRTGWARICATRPCHPRRRRNARRPGGPGRR